MPKFRMKDLTAGLPAGGVHAHQAGSCGSFTVNCEACTSSPTACTLVTFCITCTGRCTAPLTFAAQAAAVPCGCTQIATACGGCSHITNPCLGCTQVMSICGGCSHITNPCIACTGSPTFVEANLPPWCPPITVGAEAVACGIISRCLPWTIGPVCHGGFTHHPGLGPDPAQHLATLKEQLRAQLRQIEEAETGLPSDPAQAAELEDRLQHALDRLREHRTRLKEEGGDDNRESGGD
jgi:hypothetical protein